MLDRPVSLRELARNPLAWLCAGGLALGLFVFIPHLAASVEIALLAGLMILLGATANQEIRQEARRDRPEAAWKPRAYAPQHTRRLEPADRVRCRARRLYVGDRLAE